MKLTDDHIALLVKIGNGLRNFTPAEWTAEDYKIGRELYSTRYFDWAMAPPVYREFTATLTPKGLKAIETYTRLGSTDPSI